MNPSRSEKAERGSKRREGNEPSRVPSISLREGSGMGERFATNRVTSIGSMTAHDRGRSGTSPKLGLLLPGAP